MEASGGIGIGIGVGFVIGFVVALVFVGGNSIGTSIVQDIPIIENIPDLVHNQPELGHIEAYYQDSTDRFVVMVILTDKNAEYTTTDGKLSIEVQKDGRRVYSTSEEIVKDDFIAWKDNSGQKVTGYRFEANKFFSSGSHDVYVTLELPEGGAFSNLHNSFYSLN